MARRTIRIEKPKSRRRWRINPATRVAESSKVYRRSVERERAQEMVSEELTGQGEKAKGRILGIDYGGRRVGLAVSDPLGITAQGIETIHRTSDEGLLAQLGELIDEYGVEKIVVGLPLSLDGTCGEKAQEVTRFIERLKTRLRLPVVAWDERMTTSAAYRTMHEMGRKAKRAKGKLDRIAAALILQNYLDCVHKDD